MSTDFGPMTTPGYARGGLAQMADEVRSAGRYTDTELLHVDPDEIEALEALLGPTTVNPQTGMREAFNWRAALPGLVSAFAPGMGGAVGGALGLTGQAANVVGNALVGGGIGALTGEDPLRSALVGGGTAFVAPMVTGFFGGQQGAATAPQAAPQASAASTTPAGPEPSILAATAPRPDPVLRSILPLTTGTTPVMSPETRQREEAPQAGLGAMWNRMGPMQKIMLGAAGLSLLGGMRRPKQQSGPPPSRVPPGWNDPLPQTNVQRRVRPDAVTDWYTYGMRPQAQFFDQTVRMAEGGSVDEAVEMLPEDEPMGGLEMMAAEAGAGEEMSSQYVEGPGSGREDLIPAQLSDGEYVMDAETVALLGDGSSDEGARRLDEMREKIRAHKGRALAQGRFSPDAKDPMSYLGSE